MDNVHRSTAVSDWLRASGFAEDVVSRFKEDEFDWDAILTLTDEELKHTYHIEDESTRQALVDAINRLTVHAVPADQKLLSREEDMVDNCQEVEGFEGLWIGPYESAEDLRSLNQKKITHILTVGVWMQPLHPNALSYKVINVYDMPDQNLLKYFEECHEFIDQGRAAGGVLVHCQAGISRSSTITISYVMSKLKKPYLDCLAIVKGSRSIVEPNSGFERQLQLYQAMSYKFDREHLGYKKMVKTPFQW